MSKFKVVYAMSYNVEAASKEEAEDKAWKLFNEDVAKAMSESGCPDCFGSNVEEENDILVKQ